MDKSSVRWAPGAHFWNIFPLQFKSMEILFCSQLDSNKVIATTFCTQDESCTIMACAKICSYVFASNWIIARWNFHQICIKSKTSFVKWAACPQTSPKCYSTSQDVCIWFALCCVLLWFATGKIFPYPSGLLHWHWGNHTIAPAPVKQPWGIWVHTVTVKSPI